MFSVRVVWRAPTSFLRRGSHREGNTNLSHSTKRNLGNYVEICTDVVALGIHFQKSAKWVTNPNLAYSMDPSGINASNSSSRSHSECVFE